MMGHQPGRGGLMTEQNGPFTTGVWQWPAGRGRWWARCPYCGNDLGSAASASEATARLSAHDAAQHPDPRPVRPYYLDELAVIRYEGVCEECGWRSEQMSEKSDAGAAVRQHIDEDHPRQEERLTTPTTLACPTCGSTNLDTLEITTCVAECDRITAAGPDFSGTTEYDRGHQRTVGVVCNDCGWEHIAAAWKDAYHRVAESPNTDNEWLAQLAVARQ